MTLSVIAANPPPLAKTEAAVSVRGVSKMFKPVKENAGIQALRDVSFEIEPATFVSLVGPSGCGKTTLLRLLNGLLQPDSGEILIAGQPPSPGPDMGFVFQSFRLLPWRTVRANVYLPLEVNGMSTAECRERADHYIDLVGLQRFATAYPSELSGGMKQRVALARALVGEPNYLLMDEPFASLDAQTREFMQIELAKIWHQHKSVVVFVTHSVDEAVLLSDRIILLSPRPGQVAEIIPVDLPHPRWDYDARARPDFVKLRGYLWDRIKAMVAADPQSEFFRQPGAADATAPSAGKWL